MRGRLGFIAIGCATVLALLLSAAPASAAGAPRASFFAALQGSDGYEIDLSTVGVKQARVEVFRGDASTTYTVRSRITRHGFKADFGDLGRISVHFVADAHRDRSGARRCRRVAIQFGEMRGTIRFRGEGGYAAVALHRAPAIRFLQRSRGCGAGERRPGSTRPRVAYTLLGAVERSASRTLTFAALGFEEVGLAPEEGEPLSIPGLLVVADLSERLQRVAIHRSALRLFEEGIFLSEAGIDPIRVTVGLPPPFSGTADFRQAAGAAPTWVGDLAVSFPGAARVPLTGPGFQPIFCRATSQRAFQRCAKPIEEDRPGPSLLRAQASGSQSQARWDVSTSWLR